MKIFRFLFHERKLYAWLRMATDSKCFGNHLIIHFNEFDLFPDINWRIPQRYIITVLWDAFESVSLHLGLALFYLSLESCHTMLVLVKSFKRRAKCKGKAKRNKNNTTDSIGSVFVLSFSPLSCCCRGRAIYNDVCLRVCVGVIDTSL